MILKFGLARLSIICLLVILFPLVQNQWRNLYLFDINNFSIYRLLYYFSGLVCPILVSFNSLNNFTNYDFYNNKQNNNAYVKGRELLLLTTITLFTLSYLVLNYIFINFKIFFKLFINSNEYISTFESDKQIFFVIIICILLIFKKLCLFIKKIILINFFIISLNIWFSQINNILLNDLFSINNIFKFENLYVLNIIYLLTLEIIFYFWSYISYSSYLSDWSLPIPKTIGVTPVLNIVFFHFLPLLYYSILLN